MDEQPQPQPDMADSEMAAGTTPDAEATRRTRVVTKRSDPAVPTEGVLNRMRIWSKHSRPLTRAVVSEQPEKRARIPETPASVNSETFAMMLESDGNLETHTELNAVALDLHATDPETMWSSDLEWVPKSILHEARDKEAKKLQQFETHEEVPQAEAEGQDLISSRFVVKWEECGELRFRLVSRDYESSHADLASLFAATPSVVATRSALVLGLAQYVGVVWNIKRYLYGDFDKAMLELGFKRLESEPGCFVKKGVTNKDTIIVVVHVDDLLSGWEAKTSRQLLCATGENVETQACRVH